MVRLVQIGEGSNRVNNGVDELDADGSPVDGQVRRGKGLEMEPGDDAKVAAASLQRAEQIRVVRRVGVDNLAARQHHLVVDDAVAGEACSRRVPRDTTAEQEPPTPTTPSLPPITLTPYSSRLA